MRETSLVSSQVLPGACPPCRVHLPGRALIAATGADAAHFLHAVLTAGIETLAPGAARLAALLTPQGKIIADMLVANASDEEPLYFLDINRGFAEEVARRLANYRLRARVELAILDASIEVHALLGAPAEAGEDFYCFADPRGEGLGSRLYGPAAALAAAFPHLPLAAEQAYLARRIALVIPECGPDYRPNACYPHEANMDQLGGIDFRKGCYIGQEIVSRMEHRATARTRTLLARFHNGFGVESGAEIRAGDQFIGTLGLSAGPLALAQVRLDRWAEALTKNSPVTGGGVALSLQKPAYARF